MSDTDIQNLNTVEQVRDAAKAILDRTEGDLTGADAERFQALSARAEELRALDQQHNDTLRDMVQGLASGRMQAFPGSPDRSRGDYDRDPLRDPRDSTAQFRGRNPWNLREMQAFGREPSAIANELRARALSAVEKMPGATDEIREGATRIIERCDSVDSKIARHALITSNPAYVSAWSKVARGDQYAFDDDEKRAWAEADQFRAMSLNDSAGGYLVPFQLDPAVIVTSSGSYGEVRSIARQVVATGDVWNGVSSAAISWSWDAEASEVSDDSPSIAQPSIPVYKAQGFVPISIEALQDAANVTDTVGTLFAEGQSDLEGTALVTGSGVGQPTGIITALAAASPSVSIDTAGVATFAQSDVLNLQGALPARWRRKASWLANNLTYNKMRQFDTGGGGGYWTNLNSDRPPLLMGRSAIEAEAMTSTITTGSKAAVFGDFSNYVVVTRLGMTVELIPHLFGANRRPTGQRGWFAWYRVGADSVNDNAFRMLNIK
jgi:HK97 family phage major capsid protein